MPRDKKARTNTPIKDYINTRTHCFSKAKKYININSLNKRRITSINVLGKVAEELTNL